MSSVNSVRTNTVNIRARVHSERSQSVKTADYGLPVSTNRDTNPDSSGGGEFDDQRGNSFARYQSPWAPTPIVVRKLTTPAASVASAQLPKSLDTNSNPGSGSASLEQTQSAFQQQFSAVATDKEKFHALMEQAFGSSYDRGAAEKIRQQVLSGDFSWMPSIEVVDQATLADTSGTQGEGVGLGAYRSDTDTIYLSRELLAGNPDKALALLSEEVGHAIDARINSSDSAGDEGELFARSLSGEDLSVDQINAIRAENDSGVIVVDGERVEVEYGFFSSIVKSVKKAVGGVVDGVRNLVGGVVDGVKDAVGGVVTGVKDLVGGYIDIVKTGFKKIMNSKVLGQIMSVAQFIPIPIVQVVARGYNAVKAAYAVYQGIKHGSIAMVASGIAGVAGGVAGVGNALGSTASWVSTASRISATASNVAMAHSIIKEGNLAGAAQLAANYFGGDSNVSTALSFVARADSLVNAVENDDVFGVISTGTGLLQDFTGPQGDAMLSTINEHSSILQQIDTARRTGRYGDALGLLNQAFGGLDLPAGTRETITRIENGIRFAQNVDNLINDNNYAEAANMLLGQVSTQIENPETVARIEALSENLTRVDTAVTAFEEGRYDDVITITGDVLGRPLGDKATQFVRELQERANNIEGLVSAVKAGNIQSTVELLNQTLVGIDLPQQATETLSRVENSVRFAGRVDDLLDTGNYAEAANLLLGAVSSTVEDPKAVENINTLADNFTKVEAAVQAFEGGRFDEVITITSGLLGKPLGDKATQFVMQLQERANNVEALVNAVKDSDVQTSAALLSSLTNGKLDNVAGIFESVDEAVKQVESLRTAIDNEDYEDAAGIAASLSEIVIGSSQSVRNSLETLSDVLTGKVDVDGVPGASPGIVPANGIGVSSMVGQTALAGRPQTVEIPASYGGSAIGGGGFNASEYQPTIVNGFGVTALAGQTALSMQPQVVEIPASSELALSSVEQVALEKIEKNLSQGLFNDVNKAELQDINRVLADLNPKQKNNVVASLSDDQLQRWGNEIDGFRGGLSDDEQAELFASLANDLDKVQLNRVYDAFGPKLVEKVHEKTVSEIEIPEGFTEEEKELYLDLAQLGLDVAGIFDPSPISDGTNTAISLFRGKWLDAGLSAVSMVPYIGDLAKAGKLGNWAKTIDNVISMAAQSPEFARAVEPVLSKISVAIDSMPSGLPADVQDTLGAVNSKIGVSLRRRASEEQISLIKGGEIAPNGITKGMDYSIETIKNFDYGHHLTQLIGPKPKDMYDPHAHHILFKIGNDSAKPLVERGQAVLRKHGIDPIYGKENLVWAPNRVTGQHTADSIMPLVNRLEDMDAAGGTRQDMVEILEEFGQLAADRI